MRYGRTSCTQTTHTCSPPNLLHTPFALPLPKCLDETLNDVPQGSQAVDENPIPIHIRAESQKQIINTRVSLY